VSLAIAQRERSHDILICLLYKIYSVKRSNIKIVTFLQFILD